MYNILQQDNRERGLILYNNFLLFLGHPKLEDKLFAENSQYTLHLT